MDRTTLEYLEGQAKKARAIVDQIDKLKENIKGVQKIDKVIFWGLEHDIDIEVPKSRILDALIIEYIAGMGKEIIRLEQELAEL